MIRVDVSESRTGFDGDTWWGVGTVVAASVDEG